MKIPYIKLYTADLLAASRHLTAEQIGDAFLAACELAFEGHTLYEPTNPRETAFFDMVLRWKEEAKEQYQKKKTAGRKGATSKQKKTPKIDVSTASPSAASTAPSQTETDTETETKTDTETEKNTFSAQASAPQTLQEDSFVEGTRSPAFKTQLQAFSNEVLKHFEPTVKTDAQKQIWFKRNCRCLRDILKYCGQNSALALQTIDVCLTRLEKAGLTGGYEAVCRNLPEYHDVAQTQMEHSPYAA